MKKCSTELDLLGCYFLCINVIFGRVSRFKIQTAVTFAPLEKQRLSDLYEFFNVCSSFTQIRAIFIFGWPRKRVNFIIAGGEKAVFSSIEGAEDDINSPHKIADEIQISKEDVFFVLISFPNLMRKLAFLSI